jgi:hypothetical protein
MQIHFPRYAEVAACEQENVEGTLKNKLIGRHHQHKNRLKYNKNFIVNSQSCNLTIASHLFIA